MIPAALAPVHLGLDHSMSRSPEARSIRRVTASVSTSGVA